MKYLIKKKKCRQINMINAFFTFHFLIKWIKKNDFEEICMHDVYNACAGLWYHTKTQVLPGARCTSMWGNSALHITRTCDPMPTLFTLALSLLRVVSPCRASPLFDNTVPWEPSVPRSMSYSGSPEPPHDSPGTLRNPSFFFDIL